MTGRSLQVARGLNTIAARLVKNQGKLAQYGISLTDTNGQMRSTFDILKDLSGVWKNLDDVERTNLGNTLAGINQYKVLAAVMTNFDSAIEANKTALNAQGSAARENARYMESYEAKINGLKAAFQNLSISVLDGDVLKGAIGGITKVVQGLADSKFGSGLITTLLFGTAGWAGMEKLMNLKWIGAIGAQFKNLASIASLTAGGAGTFAESLAAVGGASSIALPAVLGVVGGVVALGAAYQSFKQAQYEKSYEGITEAMEGTNSEIASLENNIRIYESGLDSLTEAERAYLDILKEERDALVEKQQAQEKASWAALETDAQKAMIGQREYIDEFGTRATESYNKAAEAYNNLVEAYFRGETRTPQYQKNLQDYVSTYGEYVQKLIKAEEAGAVFDDTTHKLIGSWKWASQQLNQTSEQIEQSNNKFADSYKNIKTGVEEAQNALADYAGATSFDYTSAIKGYQSAFAELKTALESGTANIDQIRAGVQLFIPPEVQKELGYDLTNYADELGKIFSGKLGSVLSASDPLAGLVQAIQSDGGQIVTSSGEIAATIDSDNQLSIISYAKLADALGTTEGVARALGAAIQSVSGNFFFAVEDIQNLNDELANFDGGVDVATASAADLVAGIMAITGASDPTEIKAYIDALYELNGVEIDEKEMEVNAAIDDALSGINDVQSAEDKIKDKNVSINCSADRSAWDAALDVYNSLRNKTVTITMKKVSNVGYGIDEWATGVDSANAGLAIVNDGAPINGSSAEAIVSHGRMFIAGGGEETIVPLEAGDTVYNARETQTLLKKSGLRESDLYGGIASFASGTTKFDVSKYSSSSMGSGGYSPTPQVASIATDNSEKMKEEFDKWLKAKKHALAMDEITEAEYYRDLEAMNEKYLANRAEYLDDYWQHQEEIYRYQKQDLQDIITLEENLNELAKAKTQKVLVYKDGMFQYVQNAEAIAKAQRAVDGKYANGTTSANGGLSLVGEKGAELRVLNRGDGIIPADITRNLMQLGSLSLNNLPFGNNSTDIFNIGEVNLENVNNVEDLFNGLKNLALQKASARG